MGRPAGLFDVEERLAGLSKKGDGLERLAAVVDFELFRPELERAVPRADRSKGGRPPFDHVLMFKVLILQTQNSLSDERTEFYLRDRLTWMRFLGLVGDAVPDANTIWTFREALTKAGAVERLFELFDQELRAQGYLAMSGQLVDATIVAAPKQRNTRAEKQAIKDGRVPDDWQDKPAKLAQKGPRCPLDRQDDQGQVARGRNADGRSGDPRVRLPEPHQRRSPPPADPPLAGHRRRRACRGPPDRAARPRQHRLGCVGRHRLPFQEERGLAAPADADEPHPPQEAHRPMPPRTARANAKKSAVRAQIEHVFAEQKARMGLVVRTIGLARATTKIGLANLVHNMRRLLWLDRRPALA